MNLLAVQYPWEYHKIFESLIDFHLIDTQIADDLPELNKPYWLDMSKEDGIPNLRVDVEGVVLPSHEDPDYNLIASGRYTFNNTLAIAMWVGEKRHLKLLEKTVDIVALPWWRPRSVYVTPEASNRYHYYGFCNLDELRRFPVRSLSTSVPITAAMIGIDIRDRERRPKNLPKFSYDLKLNNAQIDLAISNIQAIKEAMSSHEKL